MHIVTGLVLDHELRPSKKSPFWQVHVRSTEGEFKILIWDITTPDDPKAPRKGDVITLDMDFKGVRDQRQTKYSNVMIEESDAFKKVKKEEVEKEIIDKIFAVPKASKQQLENAYKTITNKKLYKNEDNFLFVMKCLSHLPKEKLFTCAAGKSVHHAFQGGLVVHTAEVIQICVGIVSTFPFRRFINQDVVFAGATLHDMGKVYTYENNDIGLPDKNYLESMLGHIYYSISTAEKIGKETSVDKIFLEEVMHVLASHHGRTEFGAIKEPSTLEAIIVSSADYIGYRGAIIQEKLSPMKKNNTNLDEWKTYGNQYLITNAIKNWYEK